MTLRLVDDRFLEEARAMEAELGSARCRVCGCTDTFGCTDGCSWVEADLCSNCTDTETQWQDFAACRGVDPDLFFPGQGEASRPAKEVCAGCPVREHCYIEHLDEKFGIFGGLSERERRALRRQWRKTGTRPPMPPINLNVGANV